MEKTQNQRGYTLLIVLLTFVLISTFAMVLVPKVISTMKQVGKSETSTQSRDMAEMGVEYANSVLESIVKDARDNTKNLSTDPTNDDRNFCERLKTNLRNSQFPLSKTMSPNTNFSFRVGFSPSEPQTIDSTNKTSCEGFVSMRIPIVSTGTVAGKGSTELKAYFMVDNEGDAITTKKSAESVNPDLLSYETIRATVFSISGNTKSNLSRSVQFQKQVEVKGNAVLTVGGNAWFGENTTDSLAFSGGNGMAIISGNAYFSRPIKWGASKNDRNYVCIKGNAYLQNQTTKNWDTYEDAKKSNACPPTDPIVVNNAKYFFDVNLWQLDRGQLELQY